MKLDKRTMIRRAIQGLLKDLRGRTGPRLGAVDLASKGLIREGDDRRRDDHRRKGCRSLLAGLAHFEREKFRIQLGRPRGRFEVKE